MIMSPKIRMIILFLIAFVASWLIYRPILDIAKTKNMTDNPDARKLQDSPVPVLGGIAVFFGVVVGLCYFKTMLNYVSLFPLLGAMVIMLYVGTIDDIADLKPVTRLVVEVGVALLLIYGNRMTVIDFDGLWGIGRLPIAVAIPLTVVMCVGVVNAVNMIDGIDGLVASMSVFAVACFGLIFFLSHDYSFAALSAVTVGALLPFVFHNVFGRESKMFMGDGGTMMVGIMLSSMVIETLGGKLHLRIYQPWMDFNLVSFSLAVMAMPVFDTLRVMTVRMLEGRSPFRADNTHFHHYLVRAGFSHIATVFVMVCLNAAVVAVLIMAWASGASAGMQLLAVIAAASAADFGISAYLSHCLENGIPEGLRSAAERSHFERRGFWARITDFVDRF